MDINIDYTAQLIFNEFPNLSPTQQSQIEQLQSLYQEWNSKINVISRKDIDKLYLHHVLHSLAIAKFINSSDFVKFTDQTRVMDVGTGGGFPGIPLAILFPETKFLLVDSIGKKIKVVQEVANALGLTNVVAEHKRAEEVKESIDYIVSRAVTDLSNFIPWVKGKYNSGIIYLKGGDISDGGALITEIDRALKSNAISPKNLTICDVNIWFKDDFFEEKRVIYIRK